MNQCLSHVPNRDVTHTPSAIATELRPLPGPGHTREHAFLPSFGPYRGHSRPSCSPPFVTANNMSRQGHKLGRTIANAIPYRPGQGRNHAPVRGGTMPRLGATQCPGQGQKLGRRPSTARSPIAPTGAEPRPGQGQKLGRRSSTARFPNAPVRGETVPRLGATQWSRQGQKLGRRSSTARFPIAPTGAKPRPD